MNRREPKLSKVFMWLLWALAWCSAAVLGLWAVGAVWHFQLLPSWVNKLLTVTLLSYFVWLWFAVKAKTVWLQRICIAITVIYCLTFLQQPKTDRVWAADQAKLPQVSIDADNVSVQNFRVARYRSEVDFDVAYKQFDFKLSQLGRVWFLVQKFTWMEGLAHTFLTFEVETETGPQYFSVSVEIRREQEESYSPIKGIYRNYELNYVMGDELDLIGVRTVMRPDDRVWMFPINSDAESVQALFESIAERMNQLAKQPEFYSTFFNNCTNNIVGHTYELTVEPINAWDPQIVLPGYSAKFAFGNGLIGTDGESFEQLSQRCRIDQVARQHGLEAGFSQAIRGQLPTVDSFLAPND